MTSFLSSHLSATSCTSVCTIAHAKQIVEQGSSRNRRSVDASDSCLNAAGAVCAVSDRLLGLPQLDDRELHARRHDLGRHQKLFAPVARSRFLASAGQHPLFHDRNRDSQPSAALGILRTAYFIPSITSLVAVGLGFRWLFQTDGPINHILSALGLEPIPWLSSSLWAMPVLIVLSVWKQIGFNMVVFLAGLQTIPTSRYEAAELDGAGAWATFWHITLPGLRPTLIFATTTTVIFTLRSFEQPYVMTGGGPLNSTNLLVFYLYNQAFAQFDFGYAAAITTVLLAVTLVLVYVQLRTSDPDQS
jgi:ABC-type spermidine/putrescine transport system permease subunit II